MQLSFAGREWYHVCEPGERLSWDLLSIGVDALGGMDGVEAAYFVTYWSKAELQHMDGEWWATAKVERVHGSEVYNVTYNVSKRKKFIIFDLYHFFAPMGLADVAPNFGLRKLAWDRAHVSRASLGAAGFREYAMNDAHLAEKIFAVLREIGLEAGVDLLRAKTPAAASMRLYTSQFLSCVPYPPTYAIRRAAMRANQGGIGEARVRGASIEPPRGESWFGLDAVSLYPSAAQNIGGLPRAEDWRTTSGAPPEGAEGFCRVRWAFPADASPCLPVQTEDGTAFPLEGLAWVTISEARVAKAHGATLHYVTSHWYDPQKADDSFPRFMRHCFERRAAALAANDGARAIFWKNIMNCGIGKMSQRQRGMRLEELKDLAERRNLPLKEVMGSGFRDAEKTVHTVGAYWCPEWHALILGKARAIMQELIARTGSILCHTDSLLAPSGRAAREGMPREEGAVAEVATLNGPIRMKLKSIIEGAVLIGRQRSAIVGAEVAHHTIQARGAKAREVLTKSVTEGVCVEYEARKVGTLRDHILGRGRFGEIRLRPVRYLGLWDEKRRLLPGGGTVPWKNVGEYARARRKARRRATATTAPASPARRVRPIVPANLKGLKRELVRLLGDDVDKTDWESLIDSALSASENYEAIKAALGLRPMDEMASRMEAQWARYEAEGRGKGR